ncbi:uncharacterized protein HD556DRAFT_1488352 [Suillus plorans]|uniref:Uncharacterized protein n=1 Tax=Suillus plorans TaxID=116603 RepID=A0A9P7DFM8_9AGAM|nr:uncharacterized protein HD556DRAFT_1488352 [Suillus plorans]KAG1790669.1 hypothetical protein HD556DRAFT_1488352 [Suillus plorans]
MTQKYTLWIADPNIQKLYFFVRARGKKERWAANKLLKETNTTAGLGRDTPASDVGVGRKGRKDKMTANDYDTPASGVAGKQKREVKSMSVTPLVIDDDEKKYDMAKG